MVFEFEDFVVVVEATLTQGSRQEAAEGESVRRHMADCLERFEKPVFGLFVANRLDLNTTETFRHGIWYFADKRQSRLNIVPLSLPDFTALFRSLFVNAEDRPGIIRTILESCSHAGLRDRCDAPAWEGEIAGQVKAMLA